jgi:transcriptional regulator with XRE-family HTH domain
MPTIDLTATGLKIKETIKKNGMTVKEIAKIFGFTSPYPVYKWINGENLPAIDNLVVLAHMMHTTMDELVVVAVDPLK